jgi:hypothetical protein
MSIHTARNPDVVLQRLKQNLREAKGGAFVTIPTARLVMAISLIEQQEAELGVLRSQQRTVDAALIEALSPGVEVVE